MRTLISIALLSLTLLSCDRAVVEPDAKPIANPAAPTQSEVDPAAPASPKRQAWTNLLSTHGAGLAGVTLGEIKNAAFNTTTRDLVVMFDWPHSIDADRVMRPSKQVDYKAIAAKLGARAVGGVPEAFMMLCGENHGGDFEVDGARYGVYVSGGCHHVQIFDATPDAVRLLLGEEFVPLLDGCKGRVLKACRTSDELRVQFDHAPPAASAQLERAGGTKLAPHGADGWMRGEPGDYAADKHFATIAFAGTGVVCMANMPELGAPETCGMSGVTHRTDDPCRESGSCKEKGHCAMADDECRATAQTHCDKSRGCFQEGRCTLTDGACTATEAGCKAWRMCELQGKCTVANDQCVAADDDCRQIDMCKRIGACTAVDGKCDAGSDEDCAQSKACDERGLCGLRKGHCTQVTEANCQKTDGCQKNGYCLLGKDGSGCAQCWVSDPSWPRDKWTWKGGRCKKLR